MYIVPVVMVGECQDAKSVDFQRFVGYLYHAMQCVMQPYQIRIARSPKLTSIWVGSAGERSWMKVALREPSRDSLA